MFAIENVVKDISLSQSGGEVSEYRLVMIDSGASVNVCPTWFGKSTLQKSDGSVLLRGADGRALQDYGKRQIWLKIGNNLKRYDFHVVEVTEPILIVSYLCEHGIETHLAREPFRKCGDRREPLMVCPSSRRHAYEQGDSQNWCVRAEHSQKCIRAERLQNSQPGDSSKRDDAFAQPVVEDPVDADRVLVQTGAEPIPIPCEPSESEKMKHDLTHIPFKPWCTSCVKGKAPSEPPYKRIERTIEDRELPTVQCDYLVL